MLILQCPFKNQIPTPYLLSSLFSLHSISFIFSFFIHSFFHFLSLYIYKSLISFFYHSTTFPLTLPESYPNSTTYLNIFITFLHLYFFTFILHSLFNETFSHCFHGLFSARYQTPYKKTLTTREMLKVMWYDLLTSLFLLLAFLLRFDINHIYPWILMKLFSIQS